MGVIRYENWGVTKDAIDAGISPDDRQKLRPELINAKAELLADHESGKLEYLNLPKSDVNRILDFAATRQDEIDTVLLLGIGGSSLGPRAVFEAWDGPQHQQATRRLIVSENIDPDGFLKEVESLEPSKTMVCVITKSGSTIETMAKFWHVWEHFGTHISDREEHFVAVTDPENGPLRGMLSDLGILSFPVPPAVGGRFSVMTAVGLVPLALTGYPIERFLEGAQTVVDALNETPDGIFASVEDHVFLHTQGFHQTVVMPYADALVGFSEWFCQLWGESLGKRLDRDGKEVRVGLTPVRALGAVDQHSQVQLYVEGPLDKHVVLLENRSWSQIKIPDEGLPESLAHLHGKTFDQLLDAELKGTKAALRDAGVPVSRFILDEVSPEAVGALMMHAMIATSLMGSVWNINPYDQPGVELGKRVAHGLLGRSGFEDDAQLAATEKEEIFEI